MSRIAAACCKVGQRHPSILSSKSVPKFSESWGTCVDDVHTSRGCPTVAYLLRSSWIGSKPHKFPSPSQLTSLVWEHALSTTHFSAMTNVLEALSGVTYTRLPLRTGRAFPWISLFPASGSSGSEVDLATRLGQEALFTPAQSTYFPWSDGPQNCPGAKFAQVESVAVLACLLRDHRVRVLSWA